MEQSHSYHTLSEALSLAVLDVVYEVVEPPVTGIEAAIDFFGQLLLRFALQLIHIQLSYTYNTQREDKETRSVSVLVLGMCDCFQCLCSLTLSLMYMMSCSLVSSGMPALHINKNSISNSFTRCLNTLNARLLNCKNSLNRVLFK